MRAVLKKFPFFLSFNLKKLHSVVGLCSKVKGYRDLHYLLFDCDGEFDLSYFTDKYDEPITCYRTPHGHHIIVWKPVPFVSAVAALLRCPYTDRSWIALGIRRGYWFLQSQYPIYVPKQTYPTFMRIER